MTVTTKDPDSGKTALEIARDERALAQATEKEQKGKR